MKNKLFLLAFMAILLLTLVSCSDANKNNQSASNNTTSPEAINMADKTKVEIGKTYKAGTLEYTIKHTRILASGRKTAASGNHFFIVGVEIKNTGSNSFETIYSAPIAAGQFGLRDSAGKSFDVIGGTGDTDGRYESLKKIESGETVYGELMYEVPKTETKLYLTICDEKGDDGEKIELAAAFD